MSTSPSTTPPERGPIDFSVVRADVIGGLTVALVGLPQCLAYAMMSGLPPAYGLSTAAIPGLIAAISGKSRQIITGPTNTTGLLILTALGPFLGASGLLGPEGLPALALLTLMAGIWRIILAKFGGPTLLRFLPESVLLGFTAGAGILIAAMQLDEGLGLGAIKGKGMITQLDAIISAMGSGATPQLPAIGVALGTAAAIVAGKKLGTKLPIALLSVVGATLIAWQTGWDASVGLPLVSDRAPIPAGWPQSALPVFDLDLIQAFLIPSLAITVLGTLELTVSAKADGARPDMSREIMAQGLANVVGAFTSAFPASASLTRSALLRLGGAQTRFAAVFAALSVVPMVLFAGPVVGSIPQASLAGVLFATALGMINRERMARMWRANVKTRALLLITLVATLIFPLEFAFLLGVGVAIILHLLEGSQPRIRMFAVQDDALTPCGEEARVNPIDIIVVEVSGNLHYAAVHALADALDHVPESARAIIIDVSHAHQLRFGALLSFERMNAEIAARGSHLILAGTSENFIGLCRRTESMLLLVEDKPLPGASTREAICLAKRLLDGATDIDCSCHGDASAIDLAPISST